MNRNGKWPLQLEFVDGERFENYGTHTKFALDLGRNFTSSLTRHKPISVQRHPAGLSGEV